MKAKLLSVLVLVLISGCTLTTPSGEYKITPDDIDYGLEVDIKGKNRTATPTCPKNGDLNNYYVAIAYDSPLPNKKTCVSTDRYGNWVIYTIVRADFKSVTSAKFFADQEAVRTQLDVIYGKLTNEIATH